MLCENLFFALFALYFIYSMQCEHMPTVPKDSYASAHCQSLTENRQDVFGLDWTIFHHSPYMAAAWDQPMKCVLFLSSLFFNRHDTIEDSIIFKVEKYKTCYAIIQTRTTRIHKDRLIYGSL